MADKTTTLKTKTNDNVYPNIIGDNRDNAISDSAHINHTLTKDHKINFRLDTNVSGLIFNSLQKPAGLTKTKLVGVGANGQENIEIGDNLTLANGKLSATGGGSTGVELNILVGTITELQGSSYQGTYTGTLDIHKINIMYISDENLYVLITIINDNNGLIIGVGAFYQDTIQLRISVANNEFSINQNSTYNHFITLTFNTQSIYLSFNTTSNSPFTSLEQLSTYLSGKKTLATGLLGDSTDTDYSIPMYATGESGKLVLYINVLTQRVITHKNLDGWTISDLVSPVE